LLIYINDACGTTMSPSGWASPRRRRRRRRRRRKRGIRSCLVFTKSDTHFEQFSDQ
jgi:hypothetical protein